LTLVLDATSATDTLAALKPVGDPSNPFVASNRGETLSQEGQDITPALSLRTCSHYATFRKILAYLGETVMSSSSSSGFSFRTWVFGIIGSVITAVLIFVITHQLVDRPKERTIVSVNGQVFDNAARRLLENVVVHLHVTSFNEEQRTDSFGRYAFSLEGFDPALSGSMHIEAPGYKPVTYNLSLKRMSEMQDLYLDALGPAPPTGLGATADGSVTSHPAASHYVARIDAKRISALIHH
jgi:hypothetical protein